MSRTIAGAVARSERQFFCGTLCYTASNNELNSLVFLYQRGRH